MHKISRYVCITIFLILIPCQIWSAPVSPGIPLNSWIYPAMDKLTGLGLIDSGLNGTRPYTRLEAARRLEEAISHVKQADTPIKTASPAHASIPSIAREILTRMEREFRFELSQRNGRASGYIKPVRDLRLAYINTDAKSASLNYNNDDIEYGDNYNLQLTFGAEARLGSMLLFAVQPLLLARESMAEDPAIEFLSATAALGLGPMEISFGRQALWWGQGRHGSLLLTNNAEPLTMLRITNPSPVLLPWLFHYLGPFRVDLFWSRLDSGRTIPEPYVSGLRLNATPLPWLEIGASRTTIFGGEGRPDVDFGEFFTIPTGRSPSGEEDPENTLAALEVNIRLPFLYHATLYAEAGSEYDAISDSTGSGWLAGVYLPQIEPSGRLALRLEFADMPGISGASNTGYHHGEYRSGFSYEGNVMGHHAGAAGRDYFAELEIRIGRELTLNTSVDYEIRDPNAANPETHFQGTLGADWAFTDQLTLHVDYRIDRVDDYDFTPGDNRAFHFASVSLGVNW